MPWENLADKLACAVVDLSYAEAMNRLARFLAVSIASLLLAGCGIPYEKDQGYGGYTDTSIEKNLFRVAFSSPGGLSPAEVRDLALLRAAQVAQAHDYAVFTVVKENSGMTTRLVWQPDPSVASVYTHPEWIPGPHGPVLVMTPDPFWDQPSTYPVPIPFTELYIRGFGSTKEATEGATVYRAAELISRLSAQYKLAK